jgi:hypothetical protein
MTSRTATLPHYRALPRFQVNRLTHAHAMALNGENPVMRGNVVMSPPTPVTLLRHCRCQDCEQWVRHPRNECAEGIVRNGRLPVPEFPADAWHYCGLYDGPQISKDVWVWHHDQGEHSHAGSGTESD